MAITDRTARKLSGINPDYRVIVCCDDHGRRWYSAGSISSLRPGAWHQSYGDTCAANIEEWLQVANDNAGRTIMTPLGRRQRMSCGEVMVPTYYGLLRRGDATKLVGLGYKAKDARRASGIRADGRLVVLVNGYHYETPAPRA